MPYPLVTVVIPSLLKRDLLPTLTTVRAQEDVPVEVVVVADRPETKTGIERLDDMVDRLIFTGGHKGAAAARNLGVEVARGDWVAYVDDDDYWAPHKLRTLLDVVPAERECLPRLALASRSWQVAELGAKRIGPVPDRVYDHSQHLSDYLFKRRSPRVGRNSIFLPTLMVPRELAQALPWDPTLSRHQDWDWLLRAYRAGVKIVQIEAVLATVTVGSPGSISASADWRSSLGWACERQHLMTPSAYSDFLAGQTLRFAMSARDVSGVAAVRDALKGSPFPSMPSLALGMAGLVPRKSLERLAFRLS